MATCRQTSSMALAVLATVSLARAEPSASSLVATVSQDAREHDFNGTVLIQRRGDVACHRSFGVADRAFGVPTSNQTRYKVASITKAFTAVLVLQLRDEGRLDLHSPIRKWLPDYAGEGGDRVAIHNLLNHTSGLPNVDSVKTYEDAVRNGIELYQRPWTTDQLLSRFCSGRLVHEVGTTFDYNNGDYIVLGKIVERITGRSYAEVLATRILQPLGMADTGMLRQSQILPRLAPTYFLPPGSDELVNDLPVYPENWYAAGGAYSTTGDVLTFSNALFGGKLLQAQTLALMLTPGLDQYGYGLWIPTLNIGGRRLRAAQRPGSVMGANGVLLRLLDHDVTIVILSNTNETDIDAFSFRIVEDLDLD